jgi:uncharacterized membrane protein YraQ (UPF0718 family)
MDTTTIIITVASFLFNGLIGLVMYFMKAALESIKGDNIKLQAQIEHIKETFYRKEDFRDFKEELFNRLDRMESSFERKIQEVSK